MCCYDDFVCDNHVELCANQFRQRGCGLMKNKRLMKNIIIVSFVLLICVLILSVAVCIRNIFDTREHTKIVSVVVNKGDTLWNIAKKYGNDNDDIRKTIYQIKAFNDIDSDIDVGQVIYIPVNENGE